jgi:hypothetical protein
MCSGRSISTFQKNILPLYLGSKSKSNKHQATTPLSAYYFPVAYLETVRTSETSTNFCQTTWRHIPEGSIDHIVAFRYVAMQRP